MEGGTGQRSVRGSASLGASRCAVQTSRAGSIRRSWRANAPVTTNCYLAEFSEHIQWTPVLQCRLDPRCNTS